ncbi:MAG: hypothetical protein WD226_09410 [Planctomycetota bacterium]
MQFRTTLLVFAFAAIGWTAPLAAQVCPDPLNDNFWKNDTLPDVPTSLTAVAVIPGVCDGEAIGTQFLLPPGTPPQLIKSVAVPFGEQFGTAGFQALVNIEIYERSPGAPAYPNPGNKIFDLNVDAGVDAQIASHGINTIDMSQYNIVVQHDFSVICRANFNVSYPGCPPTGAPANFFTDNAACNPGVNYLDIAGQGWRDPATATVSGFPLCPFFYNGNWVIRACTEDSGTPATATVRNASGLNPLWYASLTLPRIGTNWIASVNLVPSGAPISIIAGVTSSPAQGVFLPSGELLINLAGPLAVPLNFASGAHALPIPADASLIGITVYTQAAAFAPGSIQLTNAIDLVLGV